jgi:tetratricopeptide (TPR) repeat protein
MKKLKFLVLLVVAVFMIFSLSFSADPAKAKQYLDYGNKLLSAKQYDNAIKYYAYSIKMQPTSEAYYYMALAYYYKGDKDQALRNAQYALKLNPANANAKKLVDSLAGATAGTTAGAAGGDQYLLAGHKYLKAKQYDMAIKYYQASINTNPTYQAYQFMGTAYYYKGDMANAKAAYEKSLELNPNNPQVRSILAKIDQSGGGAAGGEQRISQQMGVHPLLLASLFAGAIAVLFIF